MGQPGAQLSDKRNEVPYQYTEIRFYFSGQPQGFPFQIFGKTPAQTFTLKQSVAMSKPDIKVFRNSSVIITLQPNNMRPPFKTACFYHAIR